MATKTQTRDRVIYWTATGVVAAVMLWSGINFSLNAEMKGAFAHLGLPAWFRTELSIAKLLGVVALLAPGVPGPVRAFAYAGFAITIMSACIAHLSSGDGVLRAMEPLIFLAALMTSYVYYRKTTLSAAA
jgi:hypothetical protein